jgi:membrane-associated phospholipid phosphatase
MLASVLLVIALRAMPKLAVARTRPYMLLDEGVHEVALRGPNERPWRSFPSGHTANVVALARALARCWPETRLPAYAVAATVALARMLRGAHYPSDALTGVLAEAIVDRLFPPD